VIAASLIAEGVWSGSGVRSPEEFDPDPFLERLTSGGMPWHIRSDRADLPEPERETGRLAEVAA
jgi:saccharopine dehydrogenase-like NADP-dependent oxidoreductase